jgi:hypothetical protein
MVKESVAEESFNSMKDIRDNRIKTFKGEKYDFRSDS